MTGPLRPGPATPREAVAGAAGPGLAADDGGARWIWLAILAVALIARLAFVAVLPGVIVWPDGREYEQVARLLVERGTYGLQTLRAPGYPTFIAAVYFVFGENLLALRLVEAALGTITVGLLGFVGHRLFGRGAGLTTALLAAFHPVLAFLPSTQYSENTLALVIVLALAAAGAAIRTGRLRWWAAMGALLGAATLIRPNVIVLFPGLALGLALLLLRDHRRWLVPVLVAATMLVLAITPWVVRNHQLHGRWFFISTGGGRQLWMGNNPRTDCASWKQTRPDSAMRAEMSRLPNEIAQDRYLTSKAVAFMRRCPGRAAQLYLVKLGNLFALYPETHSQLYVNRWSRLAQGLASVVIFAGVLIALRLWRTEPWLWPLTAGVVCFALPNALVLTGMRYRIAIEPCLLLMAGLGWSSLLGWRAGWRQASPGSPRPAAGGGMSGPA